MKSWHELLLLPETTLWAWRKVRRAYQMADSLYDQAELAAFELNLEAELDGIRADFAQGRWSNKPLRLVPQPKSPDKLGNPRMRQYFEVSIRDQVAWAAAATVLGPELDRKMPAWSYGNRLYRAAWYEQQSDEHVSRLNIGPYRHAAGHLYRRFKHSWPLYRRHISLTARRMVDHQIDPELLDEGDRRALDQSGGLAYLDSKHWVRTALSGDDLYAASFDLRTFYPSIRLDAIRRAFIDHVEGLSDEPKMTQLLQQMLIFTVDDTGVSSGMKNAIHPPVVSGAFDGIPTGLVVGGFLANVAMLSVDLEADQLLVANRDIAHFRFVDDHEVLAYDFNALVQWIHTYIRLLEASGIGVEVEPDKYVPADLKWILHLDELDKDYPDKPTERGNALIRRVEKAAKLDGRKPTQLMTRTLAQVSMLAATDFDLLTDAGRSQRLEQLEWLLLANIPDQEIRADTRMSFAAARIAMLTPSLFRPNEDLLGANRAYRSLLDKRAKDERKGKSADPTFAAEKERSESRIADLDRAESKAWQTILDRHFGLLFEAFSAHPDKVRLLLRVIDFCRSTGHAGLAPLASWMEEEKKVDSHGLLRCYLGAIAIQSLARHVLTACADLNRSNLLHREREAAQAFLADLLGTDLDRFVSMSAQASSLQHFQRHARNALVAALIIGAAEIEMSWPKLAKKARERITGWIGASDYRSVVEHTGISIGVWYHWFLSTTGAHPAGRPSYWPAIEAAHRVDDPCDWISLRRYPSSLPARAWARLGQVPGLLKPDDAGWLMVAARANLSSFNQLPAGDPAVDAVRTSLPSSLGNLTLLEWADYCRTLPPHDPRRSEWTALEIVRQILIKFVAFGGPDQDEVDRLHPENILMHPSWKSPPKSALTSGQMTWAGWRTVTESPVTLIQNGLQDYRYSGNLEMTERPWARRLRPIGQLLWGTLRHDFRLPCVWNIRGQERSLAGLVFRDLELLPISSFTLRILQACLLPRFLENAFLLDFPSLFGNRIEAAADDSEFDRPIRDLGTLIKLLERTQNILTRSQMTVLAYEPRQLIPVRLQHIARAGGGDMAEAEDLS